MTTDITELAQRMKAAAESVIKNHDCEWFETGRQICTVHKSKVNLISMANPANTLALVEALEKAQQHIARQEQILLNQDESLSIRRGELEKAQAQSSKWLEAYHKAVSIGARYEERIAELESRTVTVSKSDIFNVPGGETYVGGEMISVDTLCLYLAEHGIKWEAE